MKRISSLYTKPLKNSPRWIIGIIIALICVSTFFDYKILTYDKAIFQGFIVIFLVFVANKLHTAISNQYADEVYDCDNYLKIVFHKMNFDVPLHKILNVNYSISKNSQTVEMMFSEEIPLKNNIKNLSFFPDYKNLSPNFYDYMKQLIERIDQAKKEQY